MEVKKKSRLDRMRDRWEEMQIRRRRHESIWYLGYLAVMIILYAVMIFGGVFIQSNDDTRSTKIGATYALDRGNYTLIEKQLDSKNRRAAFTLANPEAPLVDQATEVKAEVEFKDSSGEKAKTTVLQGERGYLVVVVENLPESYKAMKVNVTMNTDSQSTEATLLMNPKQETTVSLQLPNQTEVLVASLQYQITTKEKQITDNRQLQSENTRQIQENDEKISRLEEDKKYQTAAEKQETDGTISQVKESSRGLASRREALEKENQELKNQIELIKKKLEDVGTQSKK